MIKKEYTQIVNVLAIINCLRATCKEVYKPQLSGVFIHDDDKGCRHYVATDGRILVHFSQLRECEPLKSGVILKPCGKVPTTECRYGENIYGTLHVIDDTTALIKDNFGKYVFDIVDGSFPEYEKVIPPKDTPYTDKYVGFNVDYLEIAQTIYGDYLPRPRAVDEHSPCLWTTAAANCEVDIVLMPVRL